MNRLAIEIMRVASNGFMHIRNQGKSFPLTPGMSLADDVVAQARQQIARPHNGTIMYVPGEYPETVMVIELSFRDDEWRCWYYGNMLSQTSMDEVITWRKMPEMDQFLREIVADLEHAIITKILQGEAA